GAGQPHDFAGVVVVFVGGEAGGVEDDGVGGFAVGGDAASDENAVVAVNVGVAAVVDRGLGERGRGRVSALRSDEVRVSGDGNFGDDGIGSVGRLGFEDEGADVFPREVHGVGAEVESAAVAEGEFVGFGGNGPEGVGGR